MSNWKRITRTATADVAKRVRSSQGEDTFRRFAESHERSLASLFRAYADGLIDDATFTHAVRDEKKRLTAELRASKSFPSARAAQSVSALFASLQASSDGGGD